MKKINAKLIGIAGLLLGVAGIFFLSSNNEKYSSFGSIILLVATIFLVWGYVWFWMSYARSKGYHGIKLIFLIVFFSAIATLLISVDYHRIIIFLLVIILPVVLLLLPKRGSDKKTSEQRTEEKMKNLGLDKNKNWQEYYKIRAEEEEKIKREIFDKK